MYGTRKTYSGVNRNAWGMGEREHLVDLNISLPLVLESATAKLEPPDSAPPLAICPLG